MLMVGHFLWLKVGDSALLAAAWLDRWTNQVWLSESGGRSMPICANNMRKPSM